MTSAPPTRRLSAASSTIAHSCIGSALVSRFYWRTSDRPEPAVGPRPPHPTREPAGTLPTLVPALAPRLFALVEEPDDELDGEVLAWGLQFDDHAHVVGYDGSLKGAFTSAEDGRRLLAHETTAVRLVWCSPDEKPG